MTATPADIANQPPTTYTLTQKDSTPALSSYAEHFCFVAMQIVGLLSIAVFLSCIWQWWRERDQPAKKTKRSTPPHGRTAQPMSSPAPPPKTPPYGGSGGTARPQARSTAHGKPTPPHDAPGKDQPLYPADQDCIVCGVLSRKATQRFCHVCGTERTNAEPELQPKMYNVFFHERNTPRAHMLEQTFLVTPCADPKAVNRFLAQQGLAIGAKAWRDQKEMRIIERTEMEHEYGTAWQVTITYGPPQPAATPDDGPRYSRELTDGPKHNDPLWRLPNGTWTPFPEKRPPDGTAIVLPSHRQMPPPLFCKIPQPPPSAIPPPKPDVVYR